MARYTPSTVRSVHQINSEFEKVKNSIDTMVDREGTAPNQMEAELDMNSNRILNLPDPINQNEAVNKKYIDDILITEGAQAVTPVELDRIVADGVNFVFTVPNVNASPARSYLVFLDGVRQKPDVDYMVAGTSLSFNDTPEAGAFIDITYYEPQVVNRITNNVKYYGNLQEAISDTSLTVGESVVTTGYYTDNDGGGATYNVVPKNTGTPDGGSYIDANLGSVQLELVHNNVVNVKQFGAIGDGETEQQNIPFTKAIDFLQSNGKGEVYVPAGEYLFNDKVRMKPAVRFRGAGAEATKIKAVAGADLQEGIVSGIYVQPGVDYIYIGGMTIEGVRDDEVGTQVGIYFKEVHVPSYISDVTVLNCRNSNIRIENSSVIELERVWSNRSLQYALDVDTVRSLVVTGGAYEHSGAEAGVGFSGKSHIRVRNSNNYYYPVATFTGLHTEGLLEDGISGVSVGGGSEFYSVQTVLFNGWQVLGKNPSGATDNHALFILNNKVDINLNGLATTGINEPISGESSVISGMTLPSASKKHLTHWEASFNRTSGYSTYPSNLVSGDKKLIETISEQIKDVSAFTVNSTTVNIGITQADTDYMVEVHPQNRLSSGTVKGVTASVTDKTTTSCKLEFRDADDNLTSLPRDSEFLVIFKRVT